MNPHFETRPSKVPVQHPVQRIKKLIRHYVYRNEKKPPKGSLRRYCMDHRIRVYMKPFAVQEEMNDACLNISSYLQRYKTFPKSIQTWDYLIFHPEYFFVQHLVEGQRSEEQLQASDVYECPKCGERKCTYTQMQTRSADEAMTSFIYCIHCKHRWKEN